MVAAARQHRVISLDAFRGLTILAMVLSGSIAFGGVLPKWMYHAQVPPPSHQFNPLLAGITWVDLVFPFFLFAMGASFPISLGGKSVSTTVFGLFKRYAVLVFFGIFFTHSKMWVLSDQPTASTALLSLACFAVFFLLFSNWERHVSKSLAMGLKWSGWLLAFAFLAIYPFPYGSFNLAKTDIIILVLANMAFFGGFCWLFTRHNSWIRLAILPIVASILLAGSFPNSINYQILKWSPLPEVYQFYYLKYLFIVLLGTVGGQWLVDQKADRTTSKPSVSIALINVLIILVNLYGLFSRILVLNLCLTVLLMAIQCGLLYRYTEKACLYRKFIFSGMYLVIIGLLFETFEGGVKKDPSTFSYYFLTAGFAFLLLSTLHKLVDLGYFKRLISYFAANGKNPLLAYTAGSLFIMPLLSLTHTQQYFNLLNGNPLTGFLKGLIFTALVSAVTLFFTRIKLFWKT